MKYTKSKITLQDLTQIALFAAVIAVFAQITIPMPIGVPMTLQTFAVPLAGSVLGKRKGTLATIVYVLIGAVGVPVFAGFTGGLGAIFGPTGGFIVSFPFVAFVAGLGSKSDSRVRLSAWLLLGVLINFIFGMMFFCLLHSNAPMTFITYVAVPYIPLDIIKLVAVVAVSKSIKNVMGRFRSV